MYNRKTYFHLLIGYDEKRVSLYQVMLYTLENIAVDAQDLEDAKYILEKYGGKAIIKRLKQQELIQALGINKIDEDDLPDLDDLE